MKTKPSFLMLPAMAAAFAAVLAGPLRAAEKSFETPFVPPGGGRLGGALAKKEFAFRLPEHVRYSGGSRLALSWRSSPLLLDSSTLTASLNGRQLGSARLGHAPEAGESQGGGSLAVEIPDGVLQPGWNRIAVECLLQTTQVPCRDVDNPAAWVDLDEESGVAVEYETQPIFPELQRFPHSLAETVLMELPEFRASGEGVPEPVVSILLPWDAGDSELRCLVIAAARVGQTGYTPRDAVGVGDISEFAAVSAQRNGILIGLREELLELPLPPSAAGSLERLGDGEGLVAEAIMGKDGGRQTRWVVVSGADPAGLERAALALGNSVALRNAPSNSWIVSADPQISPIAEKLAHPPVGPVRLDTLDGGGIAMKGVFRNAASRTVHFPPGYETVGGGFFELDFSHAENLAGTSALEVRLNDTVLGGISLDAGNTGAAKRRIAIPAGISGRDPSLLAVSSYLDIGSVDCTHRNSERAWLDIAGGSLLDIKSSPLRIDDLRKLDRICLRDAFLRRAAIVAPAEPGGERDAMLKSLAMDLGSRLAQMPVLWPQVATYSGITPPDAARLRGRSGIVLGSADQWAEALGPKTRLVVEESASDSERLVMRGEDVPKDSFDPGLVFAQLLPSPWSGGEVFAAVGGISGYGGDNAVAMLTDPGISDRLGGTVAAYDGRSVVTYDVRTIQEASLAEEFRGAFAFGGGTDPEQQVIQKAEAGLAAANHSVWVLSVAIAVLGALFVSQRLLVRRRKKNGKPSEGSEL